jgi:hypothetical protein
MSPRGEIAFPVLQIKDLGARHVNRLRSAQYSPIMNISAAVNQRMVDAITRTGTDQRRTFRA